MADRRRNQAGKPVKKKKKNLHPTGILFTVCLILVIAPFAVLGWILFSSSMDTNHPVLGNRYEGDLDPAITKSQMSQVEKAVKAVDGVDDSFVTMKTATLRVYADVADDANEDICNATADAIYNAVAGVLDPAVYFTRTDKEKMYDLEIHVYTEPERTGKDGENFVYVIDTKNSGMKDPEKQTVSIAKNQQIADQLRQDVETRKAEEAAQASAAPNSGSGVTSNSQDVDDGQNGDQQQ